MKNNDDNYFEVPVNFTVGEHISIEISSNGSMFALAQANIAAVTGKAIKIQDSQTWLWLPKKALIPVKMDKRIYNQDTVLPNQFILAKCFRASSGAQDAALQRLTHIGQPGGVEATVVNEKRSIPKDKSKKYGPEAYVHFIGPESDLNHDYDEIPVWLISVNRKEDDIDTSTCQKFYNYDDAERYADNLAERLGLELVSEAMTA